MQPILISDYIQNGIVIKAGKVYAQVRAAGYGLFPNTSEVTLTEDSIELNFETTYYDLSFNLNGGEGKPLLTQSLLAGATGTAVTEPAHEGYTFKGWNTAQDGNGSRDYTDDRK